MKAHELLERLHNKCDPEVRKVLERMIEARYADKQVITELAAQQTQLTEIVMNIVKALDVQHQHLQFLLPDSKAFDKKFGEVMSEEIPTTEDD